MKSFAGSILVLFSLTVQVFCGSCPPANQIEPCTCVDNSIKCFAYNHDIDLVSIFETIAYGHNPGDQFFETFELTSNKITELPADVFQGVVFRQLKFNFNPLLACVNPRAFTGMEKITTSIVATSSNFSTNNQKDCDIFLAMSGLNILQFINITGSEITAIQPNAFHGRGGELLQLNSINLSGGQGGSIKSVGKNAFSELRNIRYIDLSHHLITTIDAFAFAFTEASDNELTIDLQHNWDNSKKTGLNGETFGSSSFLVGNRRTSLLLGGNPGLKYLKEDPFHSFLENKANGINKIDLQGTYLDYDWQNEWMLEYRAQLQLVDKVLNARTVDGEELWSVAKSMWTISPTMPTAANGTTAAAGNGTTVSTTKKV
jgi:hypothetical protein